MPDVDVLTKRGLTKQGLTKRAFGETSRPDAWWLQPLAVLAGLPA